MLYPAHKFHFYKFSNGNFYATGTVNLAGSIIAIPGLTKRQLLRNYNQSPNLLACFT